MLVAGEKDGETVLFLVLLHQPAVAVAAVPAVERLLQVLRY